MRSTKKNFAMQSAYQILTIITPLITAPYLSRILGPENLGIFSFTESVAAYFVLFAMLGVSTYGQRSIAKVRDDRTNTNRVFCEVFYCHAIISILSLIIYVIYVISTNNEYFLYKLVWIMYVASAFFDITWLFLGLEDFKTSVTRNTIVKIVTVISIFVFVRDSNACIIYVFIYSFSYLISQICLWTKIRKYVHFVTVPISDIVKHFKPMLVLFVAVIATSVYRMMDKVMLGSMNLTGTLGCYEYADKIIRIPVGLITALGTVMLPRMTNLYAKKDYKTAEKYMEYTSEFVFVLCAALVFGMAAISEKFAVVYLGKDFIETGAMMKILAVSIILMGWNNLIRTQYLIPLGKDKTYVTAVWVGAIANIVLNFLLIPQYKAYGAAIATDVAYFFVVLFQCVPIRKEIPILRYVRKCMNPLFNGLVMFIVIKCVTNFLPYNALGVVIEVLLGAIVYLSLSYLYLRKTNNPIVLEYVTKLRKKFIH